MVFIVNVDMEWLNSRSEDAQYDLAIFIDENGIIWKKNDCLCRFCYRLEQDESVLAEMVDTFIHGNCRIQIDGRQNVDKYLAVWRNKGN